MVGIVADYTAAGELTTEQFGQRYFGDRPSDACGVGAVASLTGEPQHQVYVRGLAVLDGVEHRGAESADGVSGDGAGLLFDIPQDFFATYLKDTLNLRRTPKERIGVGHIFLPRETEEPSAHLRAMQIVEETLRDFNIVNFAWRAPEVAALGARVPGTNDLIVGPIAAQTQPDIRQIVFECPTGLSVEENERRLHDAMTEIEKRIGEEKIKSLDDSFYVCSLSSKVIDYKAMVKPSRVRHFYKDITLFLSLAIKCTVCLAHQRFATNAAPNWKLAHPYRMLAHNGEINTIGSTARDAEARIAKYVEPGRRAIQTTGSDTAQLDTIIKVMCRHGWTPLQALRHLIPPALHPSQDPAFQDYIKITNVFSTQADGPAAIACTDGNQLAVIVDRNSLRPMNCVKIGNEVLIACSEMGVALFPGDAEKGISRILLNGGEGIAVDLKTGDYMRPLDVERHLASMGAYSQWVKGIQIFEPKRSISEVTKTEISADQSDSVSPELLLQLRAVGFTEEDRKDVISTLAETGVEVVSSMGNTKPLAVFSNNPAVHARMSNFFPDNFAQITNPAIDSEREGQFFDMLTRLGDRGDLVTVHPSNITQPDIIELENPLLTTGEFDELQDEIKSRGWNTHRVDATFGPTEWRNIEERVDALVTEAVKVVEDSASSPGATQIIVSHRALSQDRCHIPSMWMASALDKALKEKSLRHKANIIVEAADIHDAHSFSQIITSGGDGVVAFVTEALLLHDYRPTASDPNRPMRALELYKKGMKKGLMKNMGKKGDTTLNSYRGGHEHSALGVDRDFVLKYFGDSVVSPISGMTTQQLAYSIARNHTNSYIASPQPTLLHAMGRRTNAEGGPDLHSQTTLKLLHEALDPDEGGLGKFFAFAEAANHVSTERMITPEGEEREVHAPILIRDLFGLKDDLDDQLSRDDVEPLESILKDRVGIAPMSYGALGPEIVLILNRVAAELGIKINCGEGGEDENLPYKSSVKQVASARFGVTPRYLVEAEDLQIKAAQGAKPGEGGQLLAHKVDENIARIRGSTPGVALISPPPHHDIYSIEDLNQLGRDLKAVNETASISVKLVSNAGVGEIASGVMKCGMDVNISGSDGGTAAASLTSINNAGWPVEIGLADTQQNTVAKGMREPTYKEIMEDLQKIGADGSVRTGRDVAIFGILGADRSWLATAILQAVGCLMVRRCHDNTCPVGLTTQDPEYRKHIIKEAEQQLRNFFIYLGEDIRSWLARLNVRTFAELRGRFDLIVDRRALNPEAYSDQVLNIDLSPLLRVAKQPANIAEIKASRKAVPAKQPDLNHRLMDEYIEKAKALAANDNNNAVEINSNISNVDLTVGATISGHMVRERLAGRSPTNVTMRFKGHAGQSFGAFSSPGMTLYLDGDANDFVGKGFAGDRMVVRLPNNQNSPEGDAVAGNACFMGATRGKAFLHGGAGGRFAVRNSGAEIVVGGDQDGLLVAGDFASEYMTKGIVVYLGAVGKEAFVGSSGGINIVYDPRAGDGPKGTTMVNNPKTGLPYNFDTNGRQIVRLDGSCGALQHDEDYAEQTRKLVQEFYNETGNQRAGKILANWENEVGNFWIEIPDQYAVARKNMLTPKAAALQPAMA